tara:strand:- start:220 stop:735 length:516 start_codon:yes stop_codon:yes gene_type:complete
MQISLLIILFLWCFNIINWLCGSYFNRFGIYARSAWGLIGIPFAPILHGNAEHLFFNSIPLFIMLSIIPVYGQDIFIHVSIFIIVTSGILTWLFGRKAIHIGASSLIMGYWSFLITKAFQTPSYMTIIVAMLMLYYLASLFFNLFPQSEKTSWEGHLFGFMTGIAAAYLFI